MNSHILLLILLLLIHNIMISLILDLTDKFSLLLILFHFPSFFKTYCIVIILADRYIRDHTLITTIITLSSIMLLVMLLVELIDGVVATVIITVVSSKSSYVTCVLSWAISIVWEYSLLMQSRWNSWIILYICLLQLLAFLMLLDSLKKFISLAVL